MATDYFRFEGISFMKNVHSTEILKTLQDEFVVRDGDVITLAYPKSGTNWMIEIISLIHSKGDPSWVQSVLNWNRSPWIETRIGYERVKNQKDPRMYSSHLPFQLFPKSLFHSKAKVIYVIRNPRDVITSGYYFFKALKCVQTPELFEQYLECFLQGNVFCGSWFDHTHGWLSMRGKENFLIISYEELHQDIRASVERISHFLDKKLSSEELNSVLKHVSFEVMKDNKMSNLSLIADEFMDHSKGKLMRKGITGDWKNHFTVAQSEAFNKIYQEKMRELPQGLFPWE
ncbi:bile salt sulfotransferase-like [Trichechus manatus latirostris]|uniref:Sulfotransferase n=1 Tax=Trichechus manatus latirostris TaxID=127582 RepID=A0A2Y9E4Q8_TRIMA|nr:bile salt sulfotransferase-like [Trichechus manatus latirostris]